MAIRLISAMLVTGTRTRDGTMVMLEPLFGVDVPADRRAPFEASGAERGLIRFPGYEIVLLLWGGIPGQRYRITGGLGIPGEKSGKAITSDLVWTDKPGARVKLTLKGEIQFDRSAIYEFRFTVNGEPLGVLPMVIRWDDETEF